ncbi:MAG: hypothetical protein JXR58_05710 [Bacteroidales bacterium]|nr:hypothetical protein [Bacteroidales bacterium]
MLLFSFFFNSCKEEEKIFPKPEISFSTEYGYISADTVLLLSDTVKIKILAKTSSDQPLTHLNYTVTADGKTTSIDTGFYSSTISFEKTIVKGLAYNEKWEFYVRDRNGRKSAIQTISFTLDSASIFGSIQHFPSAVFGAQSNTDLGSFFSFLTGQIYTTQQAFNNQNIIDLLYFYDLIESDQNTIASPGANLDASVFIGEFSPSNWTSIRTTRFIKMELLTVSEFNNCNNDSLILANSFIFSIGKRKAKNLQPGDIYSFATDNDGKKGLFLVKEVQGQEAGFVELEIKIQE